MVEELELKWISGFWRRIGALFIDGLILGIAGLVLGLFLENTFVQIGVWGRVVGFLIALIYFGVMNSSIADGQTIGKKALKLRVVDSNNSPISIGKSTLRYFILAIPFSLNGAHFPNEVMFSFYMYLISLVIFGGIFSILYLYIFNRATRQSLHDLAVGTFVVNANVDKQEIGKVWNAHLVIVVVLFLLAAIAPAFISKLVQNEPFKDMLSAQTALSNEPNVTFATIVSGSSTHFSTNNETKKTTYISSQIFLGSNNVGDIELARKLASIVIANYPEAIQKDGIQITLTYGYDIGIAAKWSSHIHYFNPSEILDVEEE